MYSYNPDRRGLSEVKILDLETWRRYPAGDDLGVDFLTRTPLQNFTVDKETPIASIGSCFSREIKNWLKDHGYNYIETAQGPGTQAGSARYDRVYNTFTLRQEFERAFGNFIPSEPVWSFTEEGKDRLLDPYRKGIAWDDIQEMEQELAEHAENVRVAFATAAIVIVTVGQAEIWYNKKDGYVYPLVPPAHVFDSAIHGFRLSSFEENVANLERMHELLRANNSEGKIVITLSPVPLRATFRPMNSVIANSASKAILRAAVDIFAAGHTDDVVYFPAYEIITCIERDPFKEDNRHVRPEAVDRIMNLFEHWFLGR